MAVADKMVEYGLNHVGYEYLNIDDCWSVGREPNGTLIPDPAAFPDGMKAVADYVHSKACSSTICLLDPIRLHANALIYLLHHAARRASSLASTRTAAI